MSNKPHTLYVTTHEAPRSFRFFVDDLIHEGNEFHEQLNILHGGSAADSLELRINSRGGYVKYGQQMINVIKDKFSGRTATILEAEACSMAAFVFMVGDERIIYPHSMLMVHDTSMYLVGKSSESRKQMDVCYPESVRYFKSIFKDTMTDSEVEDVYKGIDFWFNAEEMCRRGMATQVLVDGELIEAKDYLEQICPDEALTDERIEEQIEEIEARLITVKDTTKYLKKRKKELIAEKARLQDD